MIKYLTFNENMIIDFVILTLDIAGVELTLSKSKLLRSVKLPFIDKLVLSIKLRLCVNIGPVSAINYKLIDMIHLIKISSYYLKKIYLKEHNFL